MGLRGPLLGLHARPVREHCRVEKRGDLYLLVDLGSTNGTLLDGVEIKEGVLKPGMVVTVGKVELKVRPYAEPW